MNTLKEYLKLFPTALKNADKIIDGIINKVENSFGILPEDEKKEIARRLLICRDCPFNSSNAVSDPVLNYKTSRLDEHCIQCGCNIDYKTSSLQSRCGLEIHNDKYPDNQIPLRWEEYKKTN